MRTGGVAGVKKKEVKSKPNGLFGCLWVLQGFKIIHSFFEGFDCGPAAIPTPGLGGLRRAFESLCRRRLPPLGGCGGRFCSSLRVFFWLGGGESKETINQHQNYSFFFFFWGGRGWVCRLNMICV